MPVLRCRAELLPCFGSVFFESTLRSLRLSSWFLLLSWSRLARSFYTNFSWLP